ncbi:MAG: SWIM zinc finger family protein [Hungatella sp.]|nr:SWIM zinc finger family protein [Hungatella sp.]
MRTVKEQEIAAMAPNANAAANARKISSGGGFVSLRRSEDDTFYMGECKGSGKNNYVVSADYIDEEHPVFRCSCPSRQFPCKHSLALLYEMAAGKEFALTKIPQDILDKREKKEAREAKKQSGEKKPATERSIKAAKAARTKKIKKQLEGLELLRQLTESLMKSGLASMGSVSLKTYRDLAKQLGDYYLPGPLVYLNRLILEMEACQKDQDPKHYEQAVEILKKLRALEKKAKAYLQDKLDNDSPDADDDELYEELGGIWKLEQLNGLGLKKEQARLVQLSFGVTFDAARKEYIDKGYWVDVDTGQIVHTCNYRPVKALKYVKEEDSCFGLLNIPLLTYYPGTADRRVRWESASYEDIPRAVYKEIMEQAYKDLPAAMKAVKNELKNTLSQEYCPVMISYEEIGMVKTMREDRKKETETPEGKAGGDMLCALRDHSGNRIKLQSPEGMDDTVSIIPLLPERSLYREGVLFGLAYYDPADRQMGIYPCSLITEDGILRLLY